MAATNCISPIGVISPLNPTHFIVFDFWLIPNNLLYGFGFRKASYKKTGTIVYSGGVIYEKRCS